MDYKGNPPWEVMPDVNPSDVPWKQGDLEPYMDSWFNHWNSLDEDARKNYLNELKAPDNWKEYLDFLSRMEETD